MLKSFVEFAAYGVAAILTAVCIFAWAWTWSGWSWSVLSRQLRRSALAVLVVLAVVATIKAQKRGGTGTTGVPPVESGTTGTTGILPVENPATNTLHFSAIAVPTNGTVALTAAWPENFLTAGQTLDILRKEDLRDETWTWLTNGVVVAGATNISWTIENQSPSNSFYKAVVRNTLTDMDDPDGDGLPNMYELMHGMNPWLNDYAHVRKLTVGPNGEFSDIFSALAESEEYSIIAVTSGTYQVNGGIQMPPHPVMVTCEDGYAVFSGASPMAMFLLENGHDSGHTLFRNLYLNLTSTSGMQAGFWCGGGLPWESQGASAVFENVHIRTPNPGVEYFGWLFYAPCDAPAVIRRCCVNASGAEWIYAVFGDNPPPIVVESCTFVNFPVQSDYQSAVVGLRSTDANGAITSTPPVRVSHTLFDVSFTNAWPLARFENAGDFSVTMTDCILPSEPSLPDFMPDVTTNMHIVTSQVAWAGFPLADSPAAALGIGALAPIPNDSLDDVDHDTLLDYNEVYEYGTDPFLADSDNDGVLDVVEIFDEHTDPTDPHSFRQNLTVTVTNTASTAYAVYTAWGISDAGWDVNGLAAFPEGFGTTNYIDASSQGATHVKAFCDLNGNGTFDADYDILRVRSIPSGSTARVDFVFGDVDGDGTGDIAERVAGSDPYSSLSCLVTRNVQISDSDRNSNVTNQLWISQSPLTNDAVCQVSFGRTLTTNVSTVATNGTLYVIVIRDLNRNGIYDEGVDPVVTRTLANAGSALVIMIGDTDGDGVVDSSEYASGTDHFDRNNFRFNTRVFFECMDRTPSLTNYVQATIDNATWDGMRGQVFLGCVSANLPVIGVTTGGVFYAKYFRDVNCNGVYDEGVDIFSAIRFGHGANSAAGGSSGILIGDCDSDGVPDSEEVASGTDPTNGLNCRFNLDLTVGGVFATSNNLTAVVLVDGVAATSPCVVTGRSFTCSLTNLYPHTGSGVTVRFWDDVNQSGIHDAGEKFTDQGIVADGTNTVVYCRLPLGTFDTDKDGMPDYWEAQNGLSPHDPTDALDDPDGDGLINLHEFWAGCDVWVPDGTDTALYAFCHAIDDRIRGFEMLPVEVYPEDQLGWEAQFGTVRNEDCWAYGIDISGASPWNSSEWGLKAGTAISRRHVIFAHHYQISPGNTIKFIGTDNSTNMVTIVANKSLAGTDITIGLLSAELPDSVTPSPILPTDYDLFIGDARRLPMLFVDNEENARITDSNALSYKGKNSDGLIPVNGDRQLYFDEVISGDSGGPKYFVCGDSAILACALYTYGTDASGSGPFTTYYWKRIQAVMDELCPGYTLSTFDLSVFRRLDDEN